MTRLYAYDGASAFDLAAARRHGGIVATVYVVGTPGGMPHADRARVNAIRKAGMGVLPNWERAADFFRGATLADCRAAGREALDACRTLEIPDDGRIGVAFSFDYQVPRSGFAHAADQLQACGDGMAGRYQPLGYGQVDLIEYWASRGLPGPHWLMGSTWRATSDFAAHEVGSPHVALVQSHDDAGRWLSSPVAGTDINTVTQPARLAAWWPDGSPYASGGTVSKQDVLDALADPEAKKLIAAAVLGADVVQAPGNPPDPANPNWTPSTYLRLTYASVTALRAALDPATLAAGIAAALPASTTVTPAEIEAAVRKVFADAATP